MDPRIQFAKKHIFSKEARILEIGPLNRQIVEKTEYPQSYTVDIRTTEEVKALYCGNDYLKATGIRIDIESIVDIDYVLKGTYAETFRNVEQFDYVIASHVLEHVTDIIGFLSDIATVLKPGGKLLLIYPDKRFCFDHYRESTTFSEAYVVYRGGEKSLAPRVLDFFMNVLSENDAQYFWENYRTLSLLPTLSGSSAIEKYTLMLDGIKPDDVHYWPFSSESFLRFLYDLSRTGMLPFTCVDFEDTPLNHQQFFIALQLDMSVLENPEHAMRLLINWMQHVVDDSLNPDDRVRASLYELGNLREKADIMANEVKLQKATISEYQSIISQQQATIGEYQAIISQQQATVGEYQADISQQKATIGEYQTDINQQQATIGEYQAIISQQQATIGEYQAEISQQKATISEYQIDINQQQSTIGEYQAIISQQQSTIGEYQADISQHKATISEFQTDINQQQTTIGEYQSIIKQQQATIGEYQIIISQQQVTISEYQNNISQQQQRINEHEATIALQQQRISEQEATITLQQQSISEQGATIALQQQSISKQETTIALQQQSICEQDAVITRQQQSIGVQDTVITQQVQSISEQGVVITQQQQSIGEQEVTIAKQQQRINEQEVIIASQILEIGSVSSELSAVLGTFSWKITKPIRVVRACFRKGK